MLLRPKIVASKLSKVTIYDSQSIVIAGNATAARSMVDTWLAMSTMPFNAMYHHDYHRNRIISRNEMQGDRAAAPL